MSYRGMLSRLAESLYWMGRYIERADDTARILDAYIHRVVEDPSSDVDHAVRVLMSIMGIVGAEDREMTTEHALEVIAYDRENPSAIMGSFAGAFENARRSRDVISSELWIAMNATMVRLPQVQSTSELLGPSTFLEFIRERAALMSGLADSTMSRDDGWRFFSLGRSIERVDMTARLLSTRVVGADSTADWMAFLRASGAMESFMRYARDLHDPNGIAGFLLIDEIFPRSVLYCLHEADERLVELSPGTSSMSVAVEATRLHLLQASQTLHSFDRADVLAQLGEILEMLESTCFRVNDEIAERFFHRDLTVSWSLEGSL